MIVRAGHVQRFLAGALGWYETDDIALLVPLHSTATILEEIPGRYSN